MGQSPRRIVVLGAPGTGAPELAAQLSVASPLPNELHVSHEAWPAAGHDFALLMGLDQPDVQAADRPQREQRDSELREHLQALGLPYRVVYGEGLARLNHALLALGLPPLDEPTREAREQAQFDLNRGRTAWSCEKCSDPDCEHRLFTGLLRRG
jgi:hypothetical protein